MVNSAAFLETMFATAKLGRVFVPINFRLAPPEVSYLLADSGAHVFVWSGQLFPLARAALAREGVQVRARVVVGGESSDGEADFEQALASGEPRARAPTRPEATCVASCTRRALPGAPKGRCSPTTTSCGMRSTQSWGTGSVRATGQSRSRRCSTSGGLGCTPFRCCMSVVQARSCRRSIRRRRSPRWRGSASPSSSWYRRCGPR